MKVIVNGQKSLVTLNSQSENFIFNLVQYNAGTFSIGPNLD